jgi:hypothetical protein
MKLEVVYKNDKKIQLRVQVRCGEDGQGKRCCLEASGFGFE